MTSGSSQKSAMAISPIVWVGVGRILVIVASQELLPLFRPSQTAECSRALSRQSGGGGVPPCQTRRRVGEVAADAGMAPISCSGLAAGPCISFVYTGHRRRHAPSHWARLNGRCRNCSSTYTCLVPVLCEARSFPRTSTLSLRSCTTSPFGFLTVVTRLYRRSNEQSPIPALRTTSPSHPKSILKPPSK